MTRPTASDQARVRGSRRTRPLRDDDGRRIRGGVAWLEPWSIGGVPQWVLARGVDADAPLVLQIHGGPGQASMPAVHLDRFLERAAIVVSWDQPGAGKSASAVGPTSPLNLDRVVRDAVQLVEMLLDRFGRKSLVLLGHSWGSVVALLAAARRPDLFDAVVTTGQIVDMQENQRQAAAFVREEAQRREDRRALDALRDLPPAPYLDVADAGHWMTVVSLLASYGGMWRDPSFARPVRWMLTAPEYSIAEKLRYTSAAQSSFTTLYADLISVQLTHGLDVVTVPTVLALGRHDRLASPTVGEAFGASGRLVEGRVEWFENSAHFPHWEEPERFADLVGQVARVG